MDDYIRRSDAINAMANILVSPMVSDDEYNIGVRRCMSSVDAIPAADVRPVRPCDGCPFCVCEKHGIICPSDPDFRCATKGALTDEG